MSQLTWHELHFPADLRVERVLAFTRVLASRPRHGLLQQAEPVVCEVISTADTIRWTIGTSEGETASIVAQLRAALPGVRLDGLPARLLPELERGVELRLNSARRSLRTDTGETVAASLLTALDQVHANEVLVLSWMVGPWLPRPVVKPTGTTKPGVGFERLIIKQPLDGEDAAALKKKSGEPLLGAIGRIGVKAAGPNRQRQLVQRVLGALQLVRDPGVGLVTRWIGGRAVVRRLEQLARPIINWPCSLNAAELANVLGWPSGSPYLAGVVYRGNRQLPPARQVWLSPARFADSKPGQYRIIGQATFPGREGYLHLPPIAATKHLHVIGPPGSGKSVLLARLIEADLVAGRSLLVIEPKADLIEAVLDRLPAHRLDDVVVLDPADHDVAVGLNPLAGADPDLVVDQLLHVLHELYQSSWGPRTAQVLHAGLLTLARAGDQAITELPLLLTNAEYRRQVVSRVDDPLGLTPYWSWFGSLSEAEAMTVVGPSLNKLGAFVGRRAIRAIIGQAEPAFTMNQLFTERRVVLVNLAKGLIGPEAARLLGSLIFSSFWQTALGRSAIPPERRHPVMVFIDEFQDYLGGVGLDFGELLAQARGLAVGISVAHQGLHQLDGVIKHDVLTNIRSRVAFQTSGPDAKLLASVLGGGLTAEDISNLGAYEAYAALMNGGTRLAPASMRSLPPAPGLGRTADVRARSRAQWGRPISEVEAAILDRRGIGKEPSNLGGRRRRAT